MAHTQCFISDLLRALARIAPPELAESWDNAGLQVGHPAAPVRRVMTCLELTEPTLLEAIERETDAIVAHHPLIFKPLTALNLAQPNAALVAELVRAEVALIAAHTNLDAAAWNTSTVLAEECGLAVEGPLAPRPGEPLVRLTFSLRPAEKAEAVVAARRAGAINLDLTPVTDLTTVVAVERVRMDVTVPAAGQADLLAALREAAPSAADTLRSWRLDQEAAGLGLGVVAIPQEPLGIEQLAERVKAALKLETARLSGPPQKKVKRVAVCAGSGGSLVGVAAARADALLTGEINYHHGIEALQRGLAVIEVGHYESEVLVARPLARRLAQDAALRDAGVEVFSAERDFQPFRRM